MKMEVETMKKSHLEMKCLGCDFEKDPGGEYSWYAAAKKYVADYPLEFTIDEGSTISNVVDGTNNKKSASTA